MRARKITIASKVSKSYLLKDKIVSLLAFSSALNKTILVALAAHLAIHNVSVYSVAYVSTAQTPSKKQEDSHN